MYKTLVYNIVKEVGFGPLIIKSNQVQIMINQPFVILNVSVWYIGTYIIWKTLRLKLLQKICGASDGL